MLLLESINKANAFLWGFPILALVCFVGVFITLYFNFVQIRYFFTGWQLIFAKNTDSSSQGEHSISPFQAFIKALSSSMGNGGLAGMAVVFVDGGLGAVFWIFVLGLLGMGIRFLEVYGSIILSDERYFGPLGYIKNLPCGRFFSWVYTCTLLILGLLGAIALQANAIGMTLQSAFGFCPYRIGLGFVLFLLYVIFGGRERIVKMSEIITPLKVILFFGGTLGLLVYHKENVIPVLGKVFQLAFSKTSFYKGALAFSLQRMLSLAWARTINATEMGLGVAGVFFGSSDKKNPLRSSLMAMITSFISTNLVCVLVILSLGVSGVSGASGLTSTPLLLEAFRTMLGGLAVPFMVILTGSFAIGVMVSYIFSGIKLWEAVFSKDTVFLYYFFAFVLSFVGAVASIKSIFGLLDFFCSVLIFINLFGLMWSISSLKKHFVNDISSKESSSPIEEGENK